MNRELQNGCTLQLANGCTLHLGMLADVTSAHKAKYNITKEKQVTSSKGHQMVPELGLEPREHGCGQ